MFCVVPTFQFSPPLGLVTVIVGAGIVKVALLTSFVAAFAASLILTNPCVVGGVLGISQLYVPAPAGVLAIIVVQLTPLLIEYSIFTLATPPLVQVIFLFVPISQTSPPFGDVTVTVGV